jgi:hypothetical protein
VRGIALAEPTVETCSGTFILASFILLSLMHGYTFGIEKI